MRVSNDDAIAVRINRSFDHEPATMYRAFVDPATAARWMWAGLGSDPYAQIDLRIGGRYRVAIAADPDDRTWPGPERAMRGVYIEIVPNERLVYTVHWDADVGYNRPECTALDEVIIVEFLPVHEGTVLGYQHIGLPGDTVSAESHAKGIEASFDLLAVVLGDIG